MKFIVQNRRSWWHRKPHMPWTTSSIWNFTMNAFHSLQCHLCMQLIKFVTWWFSCHHLSYNRGSQASSRTYCKALLMQHVSATRSLCTYSKRHVIVWRGSWYTALAATDHYSWVCLVLSSLSNIPNILWYPGDLVSLSVDAVGESL